MSKPKRINHSCCVYHVICRSDQNDIVITEGNEKEGFLEFFSDYIESRKSDL
jgi:hypothetical protein